VIKFPKPADRKRKAMTGEEFGARVAEMSPLERADFSAKLRRMADGILPEDRHVGPWRRKNRIHGPNMHTFLFRSRELILESDEADLVRDVCLDVEKAQTKLRQIRERLQGVRQWSAVQIQELTTADTKLAAAIVAALLTVQK
jgi:hypothetical protein